jgi:hypothetical protein
LRRANSTRSRHLTDVTVGYRRRLRAVSSAEMSADIWTTGRLGGVACQAPESARSALCYKRAKPSSWLGMRNAQWRFQQRESR